MMAAPFLDVDLATVRIGRRQVLEQVRFSRAAGSVTVLVGPNGAGKTSLVRVLAGLLPADGTVRIAGRELATLTARARARTVAVLPQGHPVHWPLPVRDVVALGRFPHSGGGRLTPADQAAIDRAVEETDIGHLLDRPVTALSGGERARVMLARAVAVEAPLLIADEPVAALDPRHQLAVMALLARRAAGGTTVIAVLHDLALAARFADAILMVADGRLVADGPPETELGDRRLAEVFGITAARVAMGGRNVPVPDRAV